VSYLTRNATPTESNRAAIQERRRSGAIQMGMQWTEAIFNISSLAGFIGVVSQTNIDAPRLSSEPLK
jgi:hypothetical protein